MIRDCISTLKRKVRCPNGASFGRHKGNRPNSVKNRFLVGDGVFDVLLEFFVLCFGTEVRKNIKTKIKIR